MSTERRVARIEALCLGRSLALSVAVVCAFLVTSHSELQTSS
jgi:hypothetical protein